MSILSIVCWLVVVAFVVGFICLIVKGAKKPLPYCEEVHYTLDGHKLPQKRPDFERLHEDHSHSDLPASVWDNPAAFSRPY